MHTVSQSRLLISGAYREDDTIEGRCASLILRFAPFYMRNGGAVTNDGGRPKRAPYRPTKKRPEMEALAERIRGLRHLSVREIAEQLGEPRGTIYNLCNRFGITVRRVCRDKEAA